MQEPGNRDWDQMRNPKQVYSHSALAQIRLVVGKLKNRRIEVRAKLRSSLLGNRVTEENRRYGGLGVSSGPILT